MFLQTDNQGLLNFAHIIQLVPKYTDVGATLWAIHPGDEPSTPVRAFKSSDKEDAMMDCWALISLLEQKIRLGHVLVSLDDLD